MHDPLDGHTPDLIALLELRARYVEQEVNDRLPPRLARKYLPRFFALHREFVDALRRGDLLAAKEIEPRIVDLALEAADENRPWRPDLFLFLWRLNLATGLFGGAVGRMMQRRFYWPRRDSSYRLDYDYLWPEKIGVFDKSEPMFDPPPTPANLKQHYLRMLDKGERAGYKSAQALLRDQ